jgi:long-chain acyl-CoA synthetase
MNLAGSFAASAATHADRPAVFWGDRTFAYSEVAQSANRVGAALIGKFGVQPGDRVALWLKNCPEFVFSVLGILAADAVVVPINSFLKPEETGYILNDAGIDVLICDAELGSHADALRSLRPGLKILHVGEFETLRMASPPPARRAVGDLAVIIYTSGTTGHPKGAMLSNSNLLHNVASCRRVLETVPDDRFIVILPLFHSYMMCVGLLLPLLTGGSMILVRSMHPIKSLLQEIVAHGGTILPAIPPFYRSLAHALVPPKLPLRLCVSGSAPLPLQVLGEFEEKFGIPLIEGYGLSEASPVVAKNPIHGVRKPGSIGLPIPDVELSVQDDAGNLLADGQIGEICVRGGNVMMGYWKNPEETAKVMRDGWLLTGDVGRRDEDGYYYITDRKKDMLLVNGSNVYPREIEEILYQYPGVKEAAVIGVPDPRKGEIPVAFVSPIPDVPLDSKQILQFVRERLADYKIPRRIEIIPALPRNATGKILKTSLRGIAAPPLEAE